MMRRMVKEQLLKFDGTPLFPERLAYTVPYRLSDLEARLYTQVTDYVREEFNRAENLEGDGRAGTVGFALTVLQRRLASSPEAICQSLVRRRQRLQSRLREAELVARGKQVDKLMPLTSDAYSDEDWDDLDDVPADELEQIEEEIIDQATASRTVHELRIEIRILQRLEGLAQEVRLSGVDRKWDELRRLLQDEEVMFDDRRRRRKLVIFTEHRDTLNYLVERIGTLLGRPEEVVAIHEEVGFFRAVKAPLVKHHAAGVAASGRTAQDIDRAVQDLVDRAVAPDGIVDLFAVAGLDRPNISILSEEFLLEVRALPQQNVALELLRRLIEDAIRAQRRTNIVRSGSATIL